MSMWFSADIHFGHANIIRYCNRPFETVHDMDEGIIERWNRVVHPDDIVHILGDVCMGQLASSIPLIARLHGEKILVPGNHDPVWSGAPEKRRAKWRDEFTEHFLAIQDETYVGAIDTVDGVVPLAVSHFPYVADDERDFDQWRPVDKGRWLVHGHVHGHWRQRGRQINVGLDAWGGYPVQVEQIAAMISQGEADLDAVPW